MHGKPLVYFDNAATTLRPHSVVKTITQYYTNESSTVHRAAYELTQTTTHKQHQVREKVAQFIGAKQAQEIIFTAGTTASLNLLATVLSDSLQPNDEILISEVEHHANWVPWQIAAQKKGLILKTFKIQDQGDVDLEDFESKLNPKTKVVSVAHISNFTGAQAPIKRLVQLTRAKTQAYFVCDAAQSAAHIPLDVCDLDVDFLVFSAHKLYGPTGLGVLYGKRELLNHLPPYQFGGDMIDQVTLEKTTYNELPYKFEAGTPHIAGILGLGAAIDYIETIGLDSISKDENELTQYAITRLKEISKLKILAHPEKRGSLITFTLEGLHALDAATLLSFKGVALRSGHLCAQPALKRFNVSSVLRISFSFYNTKEEVDLFIDALNSILAPIV